MYCGNGSSVYCNNSNEINIEDNMRTLITAMMLGLLVLTACSSRSQYFVTAGIVDHPNDLSAALSSCADACQNLVQERGRGERPTPRLSQCTATQCQCEC